MNKYQDELEQEVSNLTKELSRKIVKLSQERLDSRKSVLDKQESIYVDELGKRDGFNGEGLKKVTVVVPTSMSLDKFSETQQYKSIMRNVMDNVYYGNSELKYIVNLEVVENNTRGLPEVYNEYLNSEYEGTIVCFVDENVTINDNMFYEKLVKSHQEFDIVGVAGATRMELPFTNNAPTNWRNLSTVVSKEGVETYQSGAYMRGDNILSFGETNQPVKLLDGCFMSFNVDVAIGSEFKFDEEFTFNHYDLSACVDAIGKNITMGSSNILVTNGKIPTMNSQWLLSHRLFVEKYKDFRG